MARRRRLTTPRNSAPRADPSQNGPKPGRRVLLPFTGRAISPQSIEEAVRLAKSADATITPALLARVPRQLPLESPLPALGTQAVPMLHAIEQHAAAEGVTVDPRIARGRTYRDALNHLLDQEQFDHIVVPATDGHGNGLSGQDLAWLVQHAPAEITILRPQRDDTRATTAARLGGIPGRHEP